MINNFLKNYIKNKIYIIIIMLIGITFSIIFSNTFKIHYKGSVQVQMAYIESKRLFSKTTTRDNIILKFFVF